MVKLWVKWLVLLSISFIIITMFINHDDKLIYTGYNRDTALVVLIALFILSLIYTLISSILKKNYQKISLYLLILSVPLSISIHIFPASFEVLKELMFPFLKFLEDLGTYKADLEKYAMIFMILPLWLGVSLPLVLIGLIIDLIRKPKKYKTQNLTI